MLDKKYIKKVNEIIALRIKLRRQLKSTTNEVRSRIKDETGITMNNIPSI